MKIQYFLAILLSLPLSGCFVFKKSAVVQSKQVYDSNSQARIRLYGPYGDKLIKYHNNLSCNEWRSTLRNSLHHRVNNGAPRRIVNISLGMPLTERSSAALNDTGIMFRDSFKEYVIEANKPLLLDASSSIVMDSYSKSCRVAISFIPKAGKNYEAAYIEQGGTCTIQVSEITNKISEKKVSMTERLNEIQGCSKINDSSI